MLVLRLRGLRDATTSCFSPGVAHLMLKGTRNDINGLCPHSMELCSFVTWSNGWLMQRAPEDTLWWRSKQ